MLEEKLQTLIDTIERTNTSMDVLIDAVRNMFLNPEPAPEPEPELKPVKPVQETAPEPEPEPTSNPVISDEQASVIRKEALRIKKLGKLKDFSKLINQYGYEKVSLIGVKDFDEILEIAKTIK